MALAPLTFHRVDALPAVPVPGGIYFVRIAPGIIIEYVVAEDGTPHRSPKNALQVTFGGAGKPADGREIGRYRAVEAIDWAQVISAATAESAATGQADVLVKRLDGVLVARFRWIAATSEAQVTVISPTSAPGDVLIFTAPSPQDPTLAGIAGTLAGIRRIA